MLNKIRKHFVYMVMNERGMTLVTSLFALMILMSTLPFLPLLLDQLEYDTKYDDFSTRQLYHFISSELHNSVDISIDQSAIHFEKQDEKTVTIEFYDQVIRRRVDNQGHEIMLRNVKQMAVEPSLFGMRIIITTMEGKKYEKSFRNP
ncbi:competence type IV pilus minor pilin ComGF [Aquibacillus sediminis]|uniref:competence type IV pilus minor pilin ComGF n=1 Tax=Aquibacillus sediminis TaxID=2574734 RepID=UPI001108998B|nr:competence type IV pilus minor pilin ComGF [Aquibacillus sediminis]